MLTTSMAFRIQRLTLDPAVFTEIIPPIDAREVSVANGTATLLQIHTNSDQSEFRTLAAGAERALNAAPVALLLYRRDQVAFWLRSTPGGLVILEWRP
jgi:hypothetical protein